MLYSELRSLLIVSVKDSVTAMTSIVSVWTSHLNSFIIFRRLRTLKFSILIYIFRLSNYYDGSVIRCESTSAWLIRWCMQGCLTVIYWPVIVVPEPVSFFPQKLRLQTVVKAGVGSYPDTLSYSDSLGASCRTYVVYPIPNVLHSTLCHHIIFSALKWAMTQWNLRIIK